MTTFAEDFAASRRLFILRLLADTRCANESVIYKTALRGGFSINTRDDIRVDLDHLRGVGCIREEWIDTLRVAHLTERGEDAAYGRVTVAGVEHSYWNR